MEKPVRQIIYFSTAAGRQDARTIAEIAAVSRDHNRRDKITGLLVAGGHRYLQVIEGPTKMANALIERIRRDQRHLGVSVLVERKIDKRSFASWSMIYRKEQHWGELATFRQLVEQMRAEIPEQKLRDQLDCFVRRFAVRPVASPWTLATTYDPDLALNRSH